MHLMFAGGGGGDWLTTGDQARIVTPMVFAEHNPEVNVNAFSCADAERDCSEPSDALGWPKVRTFPPPPVLLFNG